MGLEFHCVDAFSDTPYQGAPILVFPRAEGLVEAQMRRIAREFGYADAVFLQREADGQRWQMHLFDARGMPLPFAGHPVVAAGAVLVEAGVLPAAEGETQCSFVLPIGELGAQLQCAGGRVVHSAFRMACDLAVDAYVPSARDIAAILSLPDPDVIGLSGHVPLSLRGPLACFIVPLKDALILRQAVFDRAAWVRSSATATLPPQILAIAPAAGPKAKGALRLEARLFGLDIGPNEDPPIGSAMPALASFMALSEPVDPLRFIALRGTGHGRLSTLEVAAERSGQTVMQVIVGGAVTPIAQGRLVTE